jgi:hypothetical protein
MSLHIYVHVKVVSTASIFHVCTLCMCEVLAAQDPGSWFNPYVQG